MLSWHVWCEGDSINVVVVKEFQMESVENSCSAENRKVAFITGITGQVRTLRLSADTVLFTLCFTFLYKFLNTSSAICNFLLSVN